MSNEIKEIAGFKLKDESARNKIKDIDQQTVNIINYSSDEDKTQAIDEILNQNKKIFIPNNEIIKADNSCFIKEKFEKFIKNGKYTTTTIERNPDNRIQVRDISKCPHGIYRDMIFPSECVNAIKWKHQKQSWLWSHALFKMADYTAICPWFQFSKNPNYEGEMPTTFNLFIGKYQVLAYDKSVKRWVEVYNGNIEFTRYYNYYEGAENNNHTDPLSYSKSGDYFKYNIKYSEIETNVLHGGVGTSSDYIPTNTNYEYLAIRLNAYTDAPYGYLTVALGCDLKRTNETTGEQEIQEVGGSRTSLLTNEGKYYYLSNVEVENYDKYLSEDTFKVAQDTKIDFARNMFTGNKYIANNEQTYKLERSSNYLLVINNYGGTGAASTIDVKIITTKGTDTSTADSLISTIKEGNIASVVSEGLTLRITPNTGNYLQVSLMKI